MLQGSIQSLKDDSHQDEAKGRDEVLLQVRGTRTQAKWADKRAQLLHLGSKRSQPYLAAGGATAAPAWLPRGCGQLLCCLDPPSFQMLLSQHEQGKRIRPGVH